MAKVYSMPPDTREREKIVGGILDIRQLGWLIVGFILYALFIITFFRILRIFAFILGLPFLIAGVFFAVKKVGEYTLAQHLRYKYKFNRKIKYYINAGFTKTLEFNGEVERKEEV